MKILSIFKDKFLILVVLNTIILYEPLEKNFPHFLFKIRINFRQIIEGIISLLDCLIPKYYEKKE